VFTRLFASLSGVPLAAGASDFRLIDRRVVDALLELREGDWFLRGIVSWMGFRSVTVPFVAPPRAVGETKYSFRRMLRLAIAGVTGFSVTPLRIGVAFGLATAVLAILELIYGVVQHYRGHAVPGWSSIIVVVTALFAVQFVLLGLIGEYIGRLYFVAKRRPAYVVDDATDDERASAPAALHPADVVSTRTAAAPD
jgi:dolichol-phosphate mannosyltransferase